MKPRNVVTIGPLSKNSAGIPHHVDRFRFEQMATTRVCNASTSGSYSQRQAWASSALRPGCLDAFRLPSRGF
jgi:hypothetical protein